MNITPYRRFLLPAGKVLVSGLTLYLLYLAVFSAPDTLPAWGNMLQKSWQSSLRGLLGLTILLMPVNWGLEARKWQLLGRKIEPLSFGQAYRAVMVGLTLGFITPNRLGDYAARILALQSKQRLEAIGAVFMGRYSQLVATVLAGSLGLLYFILHFCWGPYPAVGLSMVLLLAGLSLGMVLLLYHARALVAAVAAMKPLQRLVPYLALMGNYSRQEVSRLLLLSLGRYLVFLLQFVLLLVLFEVRLSPLQYVCGVSGTFLLRSVVPSVSLLSDLGARELSAMYLFGLLGQERLQVLSASLGLWLLNIALPSAAGLVLVLRVRWQRKGAMA